MSDPPGARPRTANSERANTTAFAVLKAVHRDHPVLIHGLYTYLSVTALLLALTAALATRG